MKKNARGLVFGWGINDSDYKTNPGFNLDGVRVKCPYYRRWFDMIRRCHDPKFAEYRPGYSEACVNLNWKYFSNFKAWMEQQEWEGMVLDKDILVPRNKEYGPSTCAFVPNYINTLITNKTIKSKYLLGASFDPKSAASKNPWRAATQDSRIKKQIHFGSFSTEIEAHRAYQLGKADMIDNIILYWMLDKSYDQSVANALHKRSNLLREDHENHNVTTYV